MIKRFTSTLFLAILFAGLAIGFGLTSVPLQAQSTSGAIVGIVADGSGAVVSGATVTATDLATNNKTTVTTTRTGEFRLLDLLPSNYRLEISARTFKNYVVDSATVQLEGTLRVNATLEVGSETQTVEVSTQPGLLQTETATVGYVVEAKQIDQTPLNGRNVENLIALEPGVVPGNNSLGSAGENQQSHTANSGFGNYEIGGGLFQAASQYIDDAPINAFGGNTLTLIITQDAVQEFRVETNAVSPQYGRFGGGVVSLVTKGGGNKMHGSLYEYFRNKALNANNFFNNYSGLARPIWNTDQFGATAGGPIKRDKAFAFVSWEGFRDWLGVPNPTNVPTAAMQAGYFTRQIADPTGRCTTINQVQSGTYAGMYQVPQSCWDPTSTVLKALWPAPLTPNNPLSNYYVAPKTGTATNQYTGRVDYNLSAKQKLFGRYTYWTLQDISPQEFAGGYPAGSVVNSVQTGNAFRKTAAHQAVLGDTYTINANTIANLRVSYNRAYYNQVPPGLGISQSVWGSTAFTNLAPFEFAHEIPTPSLSGIHNLYTFPAMNFDSTDRWNTYSVIGDVIRSAGSHTLQFGGEARRMERSGYGNLNTLSGGFTVSSQTTQVGGSSATGDEFASFLLGLMQKASISTGVPTNTFNYSAGLYALDNWKVTPNLTLNLGIRWELPGGLEENHDRATVLLPNAVDQYTNFTGTLVLVNSSQYTSRSMEPIQYNHFSPRVGFAQTLFKNTVVRGGFGLVFESPDLPAGVMAFNSTVNSQTTTTQNPTNQTATNSSFISNPFPVSVAPATAGIIQPAGRKVPNFMVSRLGQSVSGPIPTTNYPYMEQGNLTVAQELWGKLMLQVGYVASKGTHLPLSAAFGIDQIPDSYDSMGAALLTNAPCAADQGATISVGQCARPYPEYKGLSNSAAYSGSSTYNSLQAQAQFRSKSAGLLTTSYTWSKFITDADSVYQNYNNKKGERSLSAGDVPHRVVINYVYNLPFGRGQKFGSNITGVASTVVSGWSVNGVTTLQSGLPLAITLNGGNVLSQQFGAGTIRPNYTPSNPGCNGQPKTSGSAVQRATQTGWFNAACFTSPGSYAFGNEPRLDSHLRAEGVNNYDFAVEKSTSIKDAATVKFRMEFYDLFNRVQFAAPSAALTGANFGLVTATSTAYPERLIQASLRISY